MNRSALLLLVAASPLVAHADDSAAFARIDAAIEKARKAFNVPGASLAIVRDDKVVYAKGFGYRDVAKKLHATPETVYAIGSSTKAFTGLLVALAAQEGRLSLDDSPKKYLPGFHISRPDTDKRITITDMLCHRSGLPRTDLAWYSGAFDRDQLMRIVGEAETTAPLRQKWQYQNLMFLFSGEVAEKVYGEPYNNLLSERFFSPLGMKSTLSTYAAMLACPERATGYDPAGGLTASRPLPLYNTDVICPAGGICSNVLDMAQWLRLQINRGTVDGKVYAKPETIAETWKPRIEIAPGTGMTYGFGWMIHKWEDQKLIEHGGNIDGFNAEVAFLPDAKIGIVMLTNVSSGPLANQSVDIVCRELLGKKAEAKPNAKGPEVKFKDAPDSIAGDYTIKIASVNVSIIRDKGKTLLQQGDVKLPLDLIADNTYQAKVQGNPLFKIHCNPVKDDPSKFDLVLEQSGMKLLLEKAAPYTSPIAAAALLAQVVEAEGGKAAILKHRHIVTHIHGFMPSDAVTVVGVTYADEGKKSAMFGALFAAGHRFGSLQAFCDGRISYQGTSFTQAQPKPESMSKDEVNAADITLDLDPANYSSLKIVKEEKVGDDETYVLRKQPKRGGSSIDEWVSKKTHLVVKRKIGATESLLSDYRNVDGLMIPFHTAGQAAEGGGTRIDVDSVSFTEEIPAWVFRYSPPVHAATSGKVR